MLPDRVFNSSAFIPAVANELLEVLQWTILRGFCHAQQYWAKDSQPYQFVPVTTFSDAFTKTKLGKSCDEALATPFQRPPGLPDELDPLQRSRFEPHSTALVL